MDLDSRARLLLAVILSVAAASWVVEAGFPCSAPGKTCRSLVGYASPNKTTLGHIQNLFNLKHILDIVGANALPSTTRGNYTVEKGQVIKIPFPCQCNNGTGLSKNLPVYTIQKDDTLYHIAVEVFANLVTYPTLEQLNNISDPLTIQPGQKVWIPLPCSCDQVEGADVVHYGHLVESGDQIIDVPLKACSSSSVKNDSLDFPLLVANGTDTYTANGCVKCSCDLANNFTLQCQPSQLKPNKWPTCPSMRCGDSTLGNITSTTSCGRTICAYAGYNATDISTTLATESTCPAPTGSGGSSGAWRICLQGWCWNHLLIAVHLIFFLVYHL